MSSSNNDNSLAAALELAGRLSRLAATSEDDTLPDPDDKIVDDLARMTAEETEGQLRADGVDPLEFQQRVLSLMVPDATLRLRDLDRFLTDGSYALSPEQQRELFRSPILREAFRELRARRRVVEMPVAAAAAAIELPDERPLSNGRLRLVASESIANLTYVIIALDTPLVGDRAMLIVEHPAHVFLKIPVSLDGDLLIELSLDTNDPENKRIVDALRSPTSKADIIGMT